VTGARGVGTGGNTVEAMAERGRGHGARKDAAAPVNTA
jgi:hypothetical protein